MPSTTSELGRGTKISTLADSSRYLWRDCSYLALSDYIFFSHNVCRGDDPGGKGNNRPQ